MLLGQQAQRVEEEVAGHAHSNTSRRSPLGGSTSPSTAGARSCASKLDSTRTRCQGSRFRLDFYYWLLFFTLKPVLDFEPEFSLRFGSMELRLPLPLLLESSDEDEDEDEAGSSPLCSESESGAFPLSTSTSSSPIPSTSGGTGLPKSSRLSLVSVLHLPRRQAEQRRRHEPRPLALVRRLDAQHAPTSFCY